MLFYKQTFETYKQQNRYKEEKTEAIKAYIMNLKEDIGIIGININYPKSTRYAGQRPEPCIGNGAIYQKGTRSTVTGDNTDITQNDRSSMKIRTRK